MCLCGGVEALAHQFRFDALVLGFLRQISMLPGIVLQIVELAELIDKQQKLNTELHRNQMIILDELFKS